MNRKSPKIQKLLRKAENIKQEALQKYDLKKYSHKKYTDSVNKAEGICRKAMQLSRTDIEAGVNTDFNDLICSIYGLCSILYRQERFDEAEPLLKEARLLHGFDGHMYSIAINSYYGCILCRRGEYDESSVILSKVMDDAAANKHAAFTDVYALTEAYGDAACAFTYSDTESGYPAERFTKPLDLLLEIKQQKFDVSDIVMKKAAYFAASQRLYYMCFDVPTVSHSEDTVKTAEICLDYCNHSGVIDFYMPATMRILAFAAARDCRFGDCVEICNGILEYCNKFGNQIAFSPYGCVSDIVADTNILLGIMHYRAGHYDECIGYFKAAIDALETDANGRPLNQLGYIDVESVVMRVTYAEKAAFAYKYIGLAMKEESSKYTCEDCILMIKKEIELITSVSDEPYFYLRASLEYSLIAQMSKNSGDLQSASKYEELSKKYGNYAVANLNKCADDRELYKTYLENIQTRKRFAMRRGLLEQYADCTRCEILMCDEPYAEPDRFTMVELNFSMGEYCRLLNMFDLAVEYFDKVNEYSFDKDGNMYDNLKEYTFSENAMLSRASSFVKMGLMAKARESFEKFIKIDTITSGGTLNTSEYIRIAGLAQNIGLNPAACAEYIHTAALKYRDDIDEEEDHIRTANLFNREGICWYNSSPEVDDPYASCNCDNCKSRCSEYEPMHERYARLSAEFSKRELEAFEDAYRELSKCDAENIKVVELLPSLLSNIGECHFRRDALDRSLNYYKNSIKAHEKLFISTAFNEKDESEKKSELFQYGMSLKMIAEIYEKKESTELSIEAFTRAIEVFSRIDSENARYELALCLNTRGFLNYRLGKYHQEIEDVTRAIKARSESENSEIAVAIMLKNRSEAHEALGDYESMHKDLAKSIEVLGGSQAPTEILNPIYGEHWMSLAMCQEELNKDGNAADSYRRAVKYLSDSQESEDDFGNIDMQVLCHFRRANCLFRRDEQEFYGALSEYDNAIRMLDALPPSSEKNERLSVILSSRGKLYELFREPELASADYKRAEQLKAELSQKS